MIKISRALICALLWLMATCACAQHGFGVKFLGDSHLGSDVLVQAFRDEFFGTSTDSVGFVTPVMPRYHASEMVKITHQGVKISTSHKESDPSFPLCGVIAKASKNASVRVELKRLGGEFDVEILHRADGNGEIFAVRDARGKSTKIVQFNKNTWEYTRKRLTPPFSITALRDGAELGGYKITRENGHFADVCASNGAYSTIYTKWGKDVFLRDFAHLRYKLFIIAYGTNDALDSNFNEQEFYNSIKKLMNNLRRSSRNAKFVLIAPPRSPKVPKAGLASRILERLARNEQVMFYDIDWAMRDDGGWAGWRKMGLIRADDLHLEVPAYEKIGKFLARDLKGKI